MTITCENISFLKSGCIVKSPGVRSEWDGYRLGRFNAEDAKSRAVVRDTKGRRVFVCDRKYCVNVKGVEQLYKLNKNIG